MFFAENIFLLCNSVDHRASPTQVVIFTLLYNFANTIYYTCKTVIATKILPLENYYSFYGFYLFFCKRKDPFLYTVLFCIHYLFRGIFKNI